MAEASIPVDQLSVDEFTCSVCLDLLDDPVTINCGHSYCKVCINDSWDQEDDGGVFSCPQCRKTFSPRPDLCSNTMLAEVVEKLKNIELQTSSDRCYIGSAHVQCDYCTQEKHTAVKSCLMCLSSFCETHLKPHYDVPGLEKHTLVEACGDLQEKVCSQHGKLIEIFCRTDGSFICYLCTIEKHKGHKTVTVQTERKEKQKKVKAEQRRAQQRIQKKQKKLQHLRHIISIIQTRADAAVQNNEKIFTELVGLMEKKRCEVTRLIRDQEEAEVSLAEELIQQLEQEVRDLTRRGTELEQLSQSQDHVHFLQSLSSLSVSAVCEDSSSITVNQHLSFDGVSKSLSDLKKQIEEFYEAEPKSREDFLEYFCELTLDPNTVHDILILTEENKMVREVDLNQGYLNHPERFEGRAQVLSKEEVTGRSYWEVEWGGEVEISLSYKTINRKGVTEDFVFGRNAVSFSLWCSAHKSVCFWHNNVKTDLAPGSRVGVYVDQGAGTLSFYSVSDTMRLLHRVHTTFTQPLYAGFGCWTSGSYVKLCDSDDE